MSVALHGKTCCVPSVSTNLPRGLKWTIFLNRLYRVPPQFSLVFLILALPFTVLEAAKDTWTGVERIVAVGDVHGDYDQFVALLRSAKLVDQEGKWIGGKTHLVQTGDVPDRGPDSRKVMDLLMKLEKQAKKAKGYVHALIGNHEAMNVYGDLRYVHPGEYGAFQVPSSRETRDAFYEQHVEKLRRNPPPDGLPEFNSTYRTQWDERHPLGYFEHRFHFGPRGKYGKWILRHNAVIKINKTLFLHGGIGPKYASVSISELNNTVQEELKDFSKLKGGMVIDQEGPLWYRGLAQNPEETEKGHLEALLNEHSVERIVMAHTVTAGTVVPRFQGRVVLIDVGLSDYYGGRLACLVIEGEKAYAIHRGKKLELPDDSKGLLPYLKRAAALDPSPSPLKNMIKDLEAKLGGE